MARPATTKPHYVGHRQRLRERFLKGGPEGIPDYELLELVLFLAQPRGDLKPLAKSLIDEFKTFSAVISAEPAALKAVTGVGEAVVAALKTVEAAAHRLAQGQVRDRSVISSWERLLAYCQATLAHKRTEEFHLLFLDSKNVLIVDERQQRGTVDHAPVYPREVAKRALELGASAIIMVHNHPSGDPTPSKSDIEMTREVKRAIEPLGIQLHDHLIIGSRGHSSFRALGVL